MLFALRNSVWYARECTFLGVMAKAFPFFETAAAAFPLGLPSFATFFGVPAGEAFLGLAAAAAFLGVPAAVALLFGLGLLPFDLLVFLVLVISALAALTPLQMPLWLWGPGVVIST